MRVRGARRATGCCARWGWPTFWYSPGRQEGCSRSDAIARRLPIVASPVMRRSATRPVSVLTQTLILRVEEAGSGDRRHGFSHFRVPRPH